MLEAAELMLEKHQKQGHIVTVCQSFPVANGIMMKVATMNAITSYSTTAKPETTSLPKIQILAATSSANCGISSNDLDNTILEGPPLSLCEILQEIGCVD